MKYLGIPIRLLVTLPALLLLPLGIVVVLSLFYSDAPSDVWERKQLWFYSGNLLRWVWGAKCST